MATVVGVFAMPAGSWITVESLTPAVLTSVPTAGEPLTTDTSNGTAPKRRASALEIAVAVGVFGDPMATQNASSAVNGVPDGLRPLI